MVSVDNLVDAFVKIPDFYRGQGYEPHTIGNLNPSLIGRINNLTGKVFLSFNVPDNRPSNNDIVIAVTVDYKKIEIPIEVFEGNFYPPRMQFVVQYEFFVRRIKAVVPKDHSLSAKLFIAENKANVRFQEMNSPWWDKVVSWLQC